MKRSILTVLVGSLAFGGVARAQVYSPSAPQFSVPGVINSGNLGTYFTCTSVTDVPQTVTVTVFDEGGAQSGTASLIVGAGTSVRFGTRGAAGLTVDSNLGSGVVNSGAARITSTVSKKLICSAFVADSTVGTPAINSLVVLSKFKHK
jgi:hypothetical protein